MCPDLWITSLLFDLNYEFINGSPLALAKSMYYASKRPSRNVNTTVLTYYYYPLSGAVKFKFLYVKAIHITSQPNSINGDVEKKLPEVLIPTIRQHSSQYHSGPLREQFRPATMSKKKLRIETYRS